MTDHDRVRHIQQDLAALADGPEINLVPNHYGLGELIDRLAAEPDQDRRVPIGFAHPHSYRGDYADLAFEIARNVSIAEMLADARSALGSTYQGWKGGDFQMGYYTSVWLVEEEGTSNAESLGAITLELLLRRSAEPLAQGGIVSPDAPPEVEDPEELFEPRDPDDLPRMAPRRIPTRVAERERAAYERGKAEGYDAAADELNDKALRAIKNAYRDGILEGRRRAVAIIEDHSEVNGELYRRMILAETGGGQDGQ